MKESAVSSRQWVAAVPITFFRSGYDCITLKGDYINKKNALKTINVLLLSGVMLEMAHLNVIDTTMWRHRTFIDRLRIYNTGIY